MTTTDRICIVCQRRQLAHHQPQTCAFCIARIRVHLAEIANAYPLLRPATINTLTLLGDGSMQRLYHAYEHASRRLPREHWIRDEWDTDPLPVIPALASWEDYWRADYGDPAAGKATLTSVIDYLTVNLDTGHQAAHTHPAFDDFAADIHRLRSHVLTAAGLADVPVAAPAECFDCGGQLLRTYQPLAIPPHGRLEAARRHIVRDVNRMRQVAKATRAALADPSDKAAVTAALASIPPVDPRQIVRLHAAGTDREGLSEDWTCDTCGRVYDQASYFLALREARSEAHTWLTVDTAAKFAGRPIRTVRTWITRGLLTVCCRVEDRLMLVWWPDVADRTFTRLDEQDEQAC